MPTIKRHLANATAFATVISAMLDEPMTVAELQEITGLHVNTTRKLVNALHGKVTFIERWTTDSLGRYMVAEYRVGRKPDAKKPEGARELMDRAQWKRRVPSVFHQAAV
jgi:transcription initiation factor IIE alpha subunit